MADDTKQLEKIVQSGVPMRKGIAMGMMGETAGSKSQPVEKPVRKGK